jgi:hypothetical protein
MAALGGDHIDASPSHVHGQRQPHRATADDRTHRERSGGLQAYCGGLPAADDRASSQPVVTGELGTVASRALPTASPGFPPFSETVTNSTSAG